MITDFKLISEDKKTLFDQGSDRYVIPLYQRAFAWGTEQYSNRENEIIQLMDDVMDVPDGDDYYLGSLIVFRRDGQNVYEVIDGQQRLTALYLIFKCLGIQIMTEKALSYDCRPKSDYALSKIVELMNDASLLENAYDNGIYLGVKTILRKIEIETKLAPNYTEKLKVAFEHVHLFRIEVPQCTDLNRYFEIMNTRGEQLEQNDIVKALLMSELKSSSESSEREIFAEVWNACSDMNGYVQMHFNPDQRENLFGSGWNENPTEVQIGRSRTQSMANQSGLKIQDVIRADYNLDISDGVTDNDERIRFESIIDFRHFLLHVLKVYIAKEHIVNIKTNEKLIDEMLDDKKLIWSFRRVLEYGTIDNAKINPHDFAWKFMICLLRCRFLFDKYIIKREFREENSDGEWSLQEMKTTGARGQKKAYYIQTNFMGYYERRTEFRAQCNKMLQACFRVSYTSPKNMHWITELLKWLYGHDDGINDPENYFDVTKKIAVDAVRPFVLGENHQLGVNTPHIVFNFLDFLLWKQLREMNREVHFEFEFRNSVEHWYPQNPTEAQDGCPPWNSVDGHGSVDRFGNLALLPTNINSRFSNQSPVGKKGYESVIAKGSLKLRKMAEKTVSSEQWRTQNCEEHESEMLAILRDSLCIC